MSIVCFHVQAVARYGHAAIDMAGGVIDQAARNRPRIVPEHFSRLRIEGKRIVRPGEVHDAVHHDGRRFQHAGRLGVKDPLRLQVGNILRSDLGKTAKAPAGVVAVVRRPIVLNLRRRIGACEKNHHPQSNKLHAINALIVDGNEYFAQGPAVDAIAIDEVNRNPGYVLRRCNGLVQCYRILGLNGLQGHFTCFYTSLVVEVSLELSRKENAEGCRRARSCRLCAGRPEACPPNLRRSRW